MSSAKLQEEPASYTPTPADPGLVARAEALVKQFPECFWFRHPNAWVRGKEGILLVIEHLREYGGHKAWREAQALFKCL